MSVAQPLQCWEDRRPDRERLFLKSLQKPASSQSARMAEYQSQKGAWYSELQSDFHAAYVDRDLRHFLPRMLAEIKQAKQAPAHQQQQQTTMTNKAGSTPAEGPLTAALLQKQQQHGGSSCSTYHVSNSSHAAAAHSMQGVAMHQLRHKPQHTPLQDKPQQQQQQQQKQTQQHKPAGGWLLPCFGCVQTQDDVDSNELHPQRGSPASNRTSSDGSRHGSSAAAAHAGGFHSGRAGSTSPPPSSASSGWRIPALASKADEVRRAAQTAQRLSPETCLSSRGPSDSEVSRPVCPTPAHGGFRSWMQDRSGTRSTSDPGCHRRTSSPSPTDGGSGSSGSDRQQQPSSSAGVADRPDLSAPAGPSARSGLRSWLQCRTSSGSGGEAAQLLGDPTPASASSGDAPRPKQPLRHPFVAALRSLSAPGASAGEGAPACAGSGPDSKQQGLLAALRRSVSPASPAARSRVPSWLRRRSSSGSAGDVLSRLASAAASAKGGTRKPLRRAASALVGGWPKARAAAARRASV